MVIKNTELKKMLKEKGKQYVIIMWCNWKIDLTKKQLEYVRGYKE